METLIIIALILAGLLLFAVEVFLVPGITLAGIASRSEERRVGKECRL